MQPSETINEERSGMNNATQRVISIENILKNRAESGRVGTWKIVKTVVLYV